MSRCPVMSTVVIPGRFIRAIRTRLMPFGCPLGKTMLGENEVDLAPRVQQVQSFHRPRYGYDFVAFGLKMLCRHIREGFIVFDQKDRAHGLASPFFKPTLNKS